MTTEERRLWDGRPATAPRLAERYWPLCRRVALALARRLPRMDADDLAGMGAAGLVRGVAAFDPSRRILPETYLRPRIAGGILDGLRLENFFGPANARAGRPVRAFCAGLGVESEAERLGDPLANAAAPADAGDDLDELAAVVRRLLPDEGGEVVVRTRLRGETLLAVGRGFGVGEVRAHQIRDAAEERLKRRAATLARCWGLPAPPRPRRWPAEWTEAAAIVERTGSKPVAARRLGVSLRTVYNWLGAMGAA